MTDYTLGFLHGAVFMCFGLAVIGLICVVFSKRQPNDGQHEQLKGEPE